MAYETTSESTEALLVTGGVGTGKTQRLVERAAALLAENAAAGNVLVLCATPQAARLFSERLTARVGAERAAGATVATARALALDVLADDGARRWSGREPRLLTAFEETFLMEDMKVSGLRPKRLREMLKFFYRSWTELADDDPDWLLPGEETDVHTLLKENLAFMRAVVEPEAANLAARYLREHDEARAAHSYAHVLMDDYACASRASQTLANLVATCSITVAGDARHTIRTPTPPESTNSSQRIPMLLASTWMPTRPMPSNGLLWQATRPKPSSNRWRARWPKPSPQERPRGRSSWPYRTACGRATSQPLCTHKACQLKRSPSRSPCAATCGTTPAALLRASPRPSTSWQTQTTPRLGGAGADSATTW